MKTLNKAYRTIEREKVKLIAKARKKGLYENFGDAESRKLKEQLDADPYGTEEQRKVYSAIQGFENWAMNFEG